MAKQPFQNVIIEAGSQVLGDINQTINKWYVLGDREERRNVRNRKAILNKVKGNWIDGVLNESYHGAQFIKLKLTLKIGKDVRQLSHTDRIIECFDEMGLPLLILGDPGSGKTTVMLELARATIAHAENETNYPIPVVLNLASWSNSRQGLADWVINELNALYKIPDKIGRSWVNKDELLLFLDGLDEVSPGRRESCVKAINQFRQEHFVSLVVCSRTDDYNALNVQLDQQGQIELQLLTSEQIDNFLAGEGLDTLAVRKSLQTDPVLQELARSPLMLRIMTSAYRGKTGLELQLLDTVETRRKHLFDTYVQEALARQGPYKPYSREQTIQWLNWLANRMIDENQSVFLIERLQPSWLQNRHWRWVYTVSSLAVGGLILMVTDWLFIALAAGAVGGAGAGVIVQLMLERNEKNTAIENTASYWQIAIDIVITSLVAGLIIGIIGWIAIDQRTGIITGLVNGIVFGIIFGLRGSRRSLSDNVQTTQTLHWSIGPAVKGGLIGVMIAELFSGLMYVFDLVVLDLFVSSLYIGAVGFFTGALFGGLTRKILDAKETPDQGILLSLRNAAIIGLIFGLGIALISWPITNSIDSMVRRLYLVLNNGLYFGLIAALWFGVLDVVQHYILRTTLYFQGHLPWKYSPFLNYATKLILLRKVGGGYIFIHRVLMEYFSDTEASIQERLLRF